jgi:hypothetical protein
MPDRIEITAPTIYWAEGHKVFLRERWEDKWEEVPWLLCNWLSWTAAPTISSAELERRYGTGLLPEEKSFNYKDYLNRGLWFVKVEVEQIDEKGELTDPLVWIGIIEQDGDNPDGSRNSKPMGVQKFLAYGPEVFLERTEITSTYAWWTEGESVARYYEGIPFNQFQKIQAADRLAKKEFKHQPGNRSDFHNDEGVYPFAEPLEGDSDKSLPAWKIPEIIRYLLHFQSPKDAKGEALFKITLESDDYLPDEVCYEIRQHGRTVKEILDELMDRRRLLGYVVEPSADDPNEFKVRPFSFLDETIDLDELTMLPNDDQKALIVDNSVLVDGMHVQESWVQTYHRVVAVGAPIVCCGTFSYDSSLKACWTTAEAEKYKQAAIDSSGYGGLEISLKMHRNAVARSQEKFERVFTAFGLSRTLFWWRCGDKFTGGDATTVLFDRDLFGDAEKCLDTVNFTSDDVYLPSLRLSKVLPLKSDHDYSGDKIEKDEVADNTPKEATWKYLSPLVILNMKDPDKKGDYFCDISTAGELAWCESMGRGAGVTFTASIHLPENASYFQLKISGDVQHIFAGPEYTSPAGLGYEEEQPLYDWKKDLLATLAIETNCRVQVQWPAEVSDDVDFLRTLWIDLSDFAALHYVAPKTVVAVEHDTGKLVRTTTGGVIRDDRPLLKRLARLAYEWYGRRRQSLSFSYTGAKKYFRVGDLITELGEGATREPIRSVVTGIRIDFGRTETNTHRTTIQTQWAELDVLRLLK